MKQATTTVGEWGETEDGDKHIWGLFHVDIAENRFVETILGVSADQRALVKYAKTQNDIQLNSHFDADKPNYRIEDMSDYIGVKTEVFRAFPLLIKKVYLIA